MASTKTKTKTGCYFWNFFFRCCLYLLITFNLKSFDGIFDEYLQYIDIPCSTTTMMMKTAITTTMKSIQQQQPKGEEEEQPDEEDVASSSSSSSYKLAFEESLHFFDDVSTTDWERLREITLDRLVSVGGSDGDWNITSNDDNYADRSEAYYKGRNWYQQYWDPNFSCRQDTKIGVGDGGKWVCDPKRLVKQSQFRKKQISKEETNNNEMNCLVYSVGSNGDFRFEDGVVNLLPGICEIHTFDFTDYEYKVPQTSRQKNGGNHTLQFHSWGLKSSYKQERLVNRMEQQGNSFKTFQQTVRELGHSRRSIDIFKIDCEGCEFSTYKDWITSPEVDIRQILMEIHGVPRETQTFFQDLHQAGYVIFHKEPNIRFGGGRCVEYGFLKLSKDFIASHIQKITP